MSDVELVVAPCDHEAAKYAVLNWHYSQTMPSGKLVKFGIWEDGAYVGCIIFGRGASPALGAPYGLGQHECCELVRIAMTTHKTPVTQVVSTALRLLSSTNPGLRLVVSFADPAQGHDGAIYRAGNWTYLGQSNGSTEVLFGGRWLHSRMLRPTGWGTVPRVARLSAEEQAKLTRRERPGKMRYAMALDAQMQRRLRKLALPFPTAAKGSTVS